METVSINDRTALERAYPPDAFAADSAQNAAISGEVVRGVRILSAPDAAGEFSLERGSRQVAEGASAIFLAPHRRISATVEDPAASDPRAGYQEFLDDIIDAARRFGFRPDETPGQGDPRIRGLRQ